jgi:hypothetical protein
LPYQLQFLFPFSFPTPYLSHSKNHSIDKNKARHTSGTASLSACALAASVVTVLLANADLERAELRSGAVRLVCNARENIVCCGERCVYERKRAVGDSGRNVGWLLGAFNFSLFRLGVVGG